MLSLQAPVQDGSSRSLFDEVFGSSGTLLLKNDGDRGELPAESVNKLDNLGFRVIGFGPLTSPITAVDSAGAYSQWFEALDADAILIRPDFYIYGVARTGAIASLVQDFLSALSAGSQLGLPQGLSSASA